MARPPIPTDRSPTVTELCDRIRAEIDEQIGVPTKEAALRVKYLSEALRHLMNTNDPSERRRTIARVLRSDTPA